MKKTLIAAAVLSALALTGCTSGNQSATPEPTVSAASGATEAASASVSESPEPSATKNAKTDAGQAWADKMINLFLNGNSKSKFADFNDELAHHYITEWSQESEGVLSVTVEDKQWSECDLELVGMTFFDTAGWKNPGLKAVHIQSSNISAKVDRTTTETVSNRCAER